MKKNRRLIVLIVALVITIIIGFNIPTMAKYITDKISSYFIKSQSFYFTSNLLSEEGSTYQIGTWSGVGPFSVSFNIYSKDNELLYTENDITYEISVECNQDVICSLNKTGGTLYASDVNHSDSIVVNVSPQRVFISDEVVTIRVSAKSTSPYIKTLTAEFNYVVGKDGVSLEIEDENGRSYLFLKVTNDIDYCTVKEAFNSYSVGDRLSADQYRELSTVNKSKCISKVLNVSFNPSDVLLDSTSQIASSSTLSFTTINGVQYINGFNYNIAPSSAFQIKFYKTNMDQDNTSYLLTNDSIVRVNITD